MYMDAFCIENAPILISIDFAQLQLDWLYLQLVPIALQPDLDE
jgi:hypothetical protein